MTRNDVLRIQRAMLTVPGVTLPRFGADGSIGAEFWSAFDETIRLAGGKAVPDSPVLPTGYLAMLAKIESGGRPYVKAGTSSASGLYQFIKKTWIAEGGQWGPRADLAFGGLQPSIPEQDMRATVFSLRNAEALRKAGVEVTRGSLYAAHFLGIGTALKVLAAPDTARADVLAGDAATKANPSILAGKTVGEFRAWLARRTA